MSTRTFKAVGRTLTALAIGTALTVGGASLAAASSRHGRDGGHQSSGWNFGHHDQAAGKVTAYTAASGSTAGSITILNRSGTSATFSTNSSTVITEVGGSGATLAVGDYATVQAAAATPTVASTISFRPPPPTPTPIIPFGHGHGGFGFGNGGANAGANVQLSKDNHSGKKSQGNLRF